MYFSTLNSSILLELLCHPQFLCDIIFLNVILAKFVSLSRYQYVLNMAEVLYFILNIEWAWKRNHNKTVWAQSQTARLCKLRYVLIRCDKNNRKICLRNTALLVVCRTVLWRLVIAFSRKENVINTPLINPEKVYLPLPQTWTHKKISSR